MTRLLLALLIAGCAAPASAQIGGLGKILDKAQQLEDKKKQLDDLTISEDEELKIGADVSAKIRQRFGVVQDPAITKYVALVGTLLVRATDRPNLPWTFIVLDTDGVNAFAAPGGYVHVTRGALGLIQNEAQLAGVLGHEIGHVTRKHTVNAIRKSRLVSAGTNAALKDRSALLDRIADAAYKSVLENAFDRGDELDADGVGVGLARRVGYAPGALADFLARLDQRNASQAERNGLFASHPETKERITKIHALAGGTDGAVVQTRYRSNVTYPPSDMTRIAVVPDGSAGLAGSGGDGSSAKDDDKKGEKKDQDDAAPKKKGFGLAAFTKSSSQERDSAQVSASGGARGVGPDRAAKGGDNPRIVRVTVTPAELAEFRKGISPSQ